MPTHPALVAETLPGNGQRTSLWKTPAIITALLLLLPLLGNHFIAGWHWRPGGFVIFGALIFGLCFAYQLLIRNSGTLAYRAACGLALVTTFSLCWGNLVQWADVNRAAAMYFGVPIVLIIGALIARFRARGMARALFATALVQASAFLLVLATMFMREPHISFWTPPELRGFAGNAVNLLLFIASALLFRQAARRPSNTVPAASNLLSSGTR